MLSASLIQLEYASKQWKSTFSYLWGHTVRSGRFVLWCLKAPQVLLVCGGRCVPRAVPYMFPYELPARVFVVCWVARKVVEYVLCSSFWGLRCVQGYESSAPSLDQFIKIARCVRCRSAQFADLSPYVLLLYFSVLS